MRALVVPESVTGVVYDTVRLSRKVVHMVEAFLFRVRMQGIALPSDPIQAPVRTQRTRIYACLRNRKLNLDLKYIR